MRIITLVTQKGGSGKTTLAACLAVAASEAGERAIALDLDPQQSLWKWGEERKADTPAVDKIDPTQLTQLSAILKALDGQGFTLAVLDTAGVASTATNLAMQVSDLCLIPARPSRIDIQATWSTVDALKRMDRNFAFVLNQCPTNARSPRAGEASGGLQMLGVLAEPLLAQRAEFQDAIAAGLGVTEYAPHGKAAEEIRALWKWADRRARKGSEHDQAAVGDRIAVAGAGAAGRA
jgi:chromosome partitioning protein